MKTKAFLLIALASISFTSCNFNVKDITSEAKQEYKAQHQYRDSKKWGKVVTKAIESEEFSSLIVEGAVDVVFTQNDTLSLKAYGNEKAIEQYTFTVTDGQLDVKLKGYDSHKSVNKDTPAITVFINASKLENLVTNGAGDINLCDKLKERCDLNITINGAGDIDIDKLKVENLNVSINGAGDLYIEKSVCANSAKIEINGAGDVDAKVNCENATLSVNGAGNANLGVKCNELTAECNGVGDIKLKGECNKLNKHDGAIGSIDSRNLKVNSKINVEK